MRSTDENEASAAIDFFVHHGDREICVAHYFRQIAISRRKQLPWINRAWCDNQRWTTRTPAWKR